VTTQWSPVDFARMLEYRICESCKAIVHWSRVDQHTHDTAPRDAEAVTPLPAGRVADWPEPTERELALYTLDRNAGWANDSNDGISRFYVREELPDDIALNLRTRIAAHLESFLPPADRSR
jgi:hypothetical protein